MKRTIVREHAFKILFRYDFHNTDEFNGQVKMYLDGQDDFFDDDDDSESIAVAKMTPFDKAEIESRVMDVTANIEDIDNKISSVCENWTIDRIGKAELAILRLAVYEIFYDEQVESPVAINEAVELSKKYCDEKSHSFVNGILAKIIK